MLYIVTQDKNSNGISTVLFLIVFDALLRFRSSQRLRQLVGTRSASAAAVDAFEPAYHLVDIHSAHERCDTLRIAAASAYEKYVDDFAVVGLHDNFAGTCPACRITYGFGHGGTISSSPARLPNCRLRPCSCPRGELRCCLPR